MGKQRINEEEREVTELVRQYPHLYDTSNRKHWDKIATANSWSEIARHVGKTENVARKIWKSVRDRYCKAKKRSIEAHRSGAGYMKDPPIMTELAWMHDYITHRPTDSESETSEPTHETQVEITAEATLERPRREEDGPPSSGALLSRQTRKIEEMESTLQSHVAKLEERRAQLEQQKATLDAQKTADDEVDKFGLMVASLLRKIPEELRPEAMFEVHKVMYEKLQKAKQTAGQQVS